MTTKAREIENADNRARGLACPCLKSLLIFNLTAPRKSLPGTAMSRTSLNYYYARLQKETSARDLEFSPSFR
jgi:hypothetical protein